MSCIARVEHLGLLARDRLHRIVGGLVRLDDRLDVLALRDSTIADMSTPGTLNCSSIFVRSPKGLVCSAMTVSWCYAWDATLSNTHAGRTGCEAGIVNASPSGITLP